MCNCCNDKSATGFADRPFGSGPAEADYAKTISVGRDVSSEDLKEMDDEEIAELTADAAREAFERMTKTRDELNEAEARQEYHEEARQAFRIIEAKPAHYAAVAACGQLANKLIDLCPASDELDVCLLKLREAMFWANAAVALG